MDKISSFLEKWKNKDKYNIYYYYFFLKKNEEIVKINDNPFPLDDDLYWEYPNYGWGTDYLFIVSETESPPNIEIINRLMLLLYFGLKIDHYKNFDLNYIYEQIFVFAEFERFNIDSGIFLKKIISSQNNKLDVLGLSLWRGMVLGKKTNTFSNKVKFNISLFMNKSFIFFLHSLARAL